MPLSPQRASSPRLFPVVLAEQTAGHGGVDTRQGYRAELKVLGTWPAAAAVASVSPALEAALQANAAAAAPLQPTAGSGASPLTLGAALLGALLGGLILNLMPCVFPILAMKVVGFARHAQRPARAPRQRHGLHGRRGAVVSAAGRR